MSGKAKAQNRAVETRWNGLAVSGGLVIGKVLRVHGSRNQVYRVTLDDAEVEKELRRFRAAVRLSKRQLQAVKHRAEKELGADHAYIFDAHLLMLEDKKNSSRCRGLYQAGKSECGMGFEGRFG